MITIAESLLINVKSDVILLIKDFLIANGGERSGYETWANGSIFTKECFQFSWMTPRKKYIDMYKVLRLEKCLMEEIDRAVPEGFWQSYVIEVKQSMTDWKHNIYETHVSITHCPQGDLFVPRSGGAGHASPASDQDETQVIEMVEEEEELVVTRKEPPKQQENADAME
jgi:hypothetical protein